MENNYLTETKVSKSNNGKGKSFTYSTVIPKVIDTKFGLDKGTKLYWDIDNGIIQIMPELPETKSIEAGLEIFNDMLINGNTATYKQAMETIKNSLNSDTTNDEKVKSLVKHYNGLQKPNQYEFKKVVTYLLDYPLNIPDQYEILREVYDEITKD